jgi:uncharacterized protein (TIGR04222 family)
MLDTFQASLYQRLQAFELDDPTHEFGFTHHLMKNQGWTLTYAQRAIVEYKKFAFLTVVANHQVVPSDQVDQVWHAHVLLTQSYWEEFCPKVLRKTLHHHPARGGRAERAEFHRLYRQTIESYQHFWGSPPIDIWSPSDVRFGAELKMQRVSLSDHWVISKRFPHLKLAQSLSIISIIVCMTIGWSSIAQGSTLERVVSYASANQSIIVICASVILGLILRYIIRSPSQQPQRPELDTYQIAYLAAGAVRVVDLVITQLVQQEYLRPNVQRRTLAIGKQLPTEANTLEQQVIQQVHRTPSLQDLRRFNQYEIDFIKRSLGQEKLLMTGWADRIKLSFLLFVVITIFGGMFVGIVINFLGIQLQDIYIPEVLYWSIGVISLCCFVPSGRTRWGSRVLANLQKNHDFFDLPQRFALYGYTVLSGGALDDLGQLFEAQKDAESGGCGCGC